MRISSAFKPVGEDPSFLSHSHDRRTAYVRINSKAFTFARNESGAIREIIRSRDPRFPIDFAERRRKGKRAPLAENGSVYRRGRGFESGADRAFTPPAQYKPGKHVSIINKKHDEHADTPTRTRLRSAADEDGVHAPSNELKSTRLLPKLDYPFLGDARNLSQMLNAARSNRAVSPD